MNMATEVLREHGVRSENPVERAVWIIGGPGATAKLCDVSWFTVRKWRKAGQVKNARCAVLMSDATNNKVTVRQLAGPLERSVA